MRKLGKIFGVVMALVMVLTTVAYADVPGGGWTSGEQVQNVGTANATLTVQAYDKTTGTAYDVTTVSGGASALAPVEPGASVNFLEGDIPAAAGSSFQGSMVVSADQPIVAMITAQNATAGGSYQATSADSASTTLYFPLVKWRLGNVSLRKQKTTTFYIQNADSSAGSFNAVFTIGSNTYSYTGPTLQPGQMAVLSPDMAAGMTDGALGALKITSSVKLAGAYIEHDSDQTPALGDSANGYYSIQATRAFGTNDLDSTIVAPIIKNKFGNAAVYKDRKTGLQVMNADESGTATDITVVYSCVPRTNLGGTPAVRTQVATGVPAGSSITILDNALIGGTQGSQWEAIDDDNLCAATISASPAVNLVGIVNEVDVQAVTNFGLYPKATTYSTFAQGNATTKLAIPLLKEKMGARQQNIGVQVQNVGTGTATVTYAIAGFGGQTATLINCSINSGAASTFLSVATGTPPTGCTWENDDALDVNASGGAGTNMGAVTITSNEPIVAVANETELAGDATAKKDDKNYEGFNLQP